LRRYGQKRVFQDFFQKSGSVTFVPLWCPHAKKIEKTNGRTDQRTNRQTDRGDYLVKSGSNIIQASQYLIKKSQKDYYSILIHT